MNVLLNILKEVWVLTNEMSPYLLLGFLLAGLMHEFLPGTLYTDHLGKNNFRSVFLAALFGVPLPLCSCGVIPTAMGLRREGASKGATVSFLIATPQTGVDSIIATYSLMGLPFAVIRPIAAFLTAILGGTLVNGTEKVKNEKVKSEKFATVKPTGKKNNSSFFILHSSLKNVITYAFIEMMEDIGKWLVIGLVIAGIITAAVPDSWFVAFQGNTLYSILFVLLMAGPASNVASIFIINKVLGRKTLAVYLFSIIAGAVVFALGIDYLLPAGWFTAPVSYMQDCCAEQPGWFSILCTGLMILLLLNALSPHKLFGGHHHCHCHDCEVQPSARSFGIRGMNCHHCAANAQKAIAAVKGVEQVTVSLEDGIAYVTGEFREEDIRKAVESLGFTIMN